MIIEIHCSGCDDCEVVRGRVCQALSDLNLNAEVISVYDPDQNDPEQEEAQMVIVIDGKPLRFVSNDSALTIKHLIDKRITFDHGTCPLKG